MICARCFANVEHIQQWDNWIHSGGGVIMQHCDTCNKNMSFFRPLKYCPKCKTELRDHHFATPIMERY